MIADKDPQGLKLNWQHQIDESLEAGETLVLEGGVSNSVVHSLAALVALDQLTAARSDMTTPWFLIGGDGVAWAMLLSGAVDAGAWAPLYAGADHITYMASLATVPEPSMHTRRSRMTGLPSSLHSSLLPMRQPGVAPLWSSMPLIMADQPVTTRNEQVALVNQSWLQWLALVFVIALIISALFV